MLKFAVGPVNGDQWGPLVLRLEHPYIVEKSEKSLDIGESTMPRKLHVTDHVLHGVALARPTTLRNCTKALD